MNQHHQSANPHKVGTVGETNEEYGGDVMNYLLLKILEHTQRPHSMRKMYSSITKTSAALNLWYFHQLCPNIGKIYMLSGVICCSM